MQYQHLPDNWNLNLISHAGLVWNCDSMCDRIFNKFCIVLHFFCIVLSAYVCGNLSTLFAIFFIYFAPFVIFLVFTTYTGTITCLNYLFDCQPSFMGKCSLLQKTQQIFHNFPIYGRIKLQCPHSKTAESCTLPEKSRTKLVSLHHVVFYIANVLGKNCISGYR